jgi:molybdopterin-guanine dinucleotide biosynthesis protein A
MTEYTNKSISAIILAGGQSSRMGRDKAFLPVGNSTLLTYICHIARECAESVYVVTPWTEKYQSMLPVECQLVREKLVLPQQKSNSPLIGFTQGMFHVKTPWVLLLACDLPQLNSAQVKQWSKYLTNVLPSEIALLPRHAKGWEPLCGFYRRSCLPLLEAYTDGGGKSFQGFLAQYPVRELVISDRNCLFNCNTPEDWQKII